MSCKFNLKHILYKNLENIILNIVNDKITRQFKNKSVEFYLMDSFEIFHYLPIYNALISENIDAKFVCEPPEINTVKKWFDYDTAINILEKLNVKYSKNANPYSRIAFTTQQAGILHKYHGKKINLNYGCGFNKSNFGNTPASTRGFDYKFVHGEYMQKIALSSLNKNQIKIIGYPKHDKYFQNIPSKKEIMRKYNINTTKPILLYYPTWDNDSSIQLFGKEIEKLKQDFFIITKAHHCTFRLKEKKEDLDLLYKISDIVLEGNSEFSDSVVLADIAIIDAKSGSSCEVPYLKDTLPILYLSVQKKLKDYYVSNIFEFGKIINEPEKLVEQIYKIWENDEFISKRKEQIEYYLGIRDAKSTERTIEVIKKILK